MEKRKLKVLQLGKQYYPHIGGIEATMQQIAEGIQGEVESYVLAAQGRGRAYDKILNGVPVHYARSWGVVASMPVSFDLIHYLCKHANDYDVIHLHMPFPLGDLACCLSGYKGKLVLYWHSDIVRQKRMLVVYKPLMNWVLRRADAIAIATQGNIDGSCYVKPYEKKCVLIPFGLRKEWEIKSDIYWKRRQEDIHSVGVRIMAGEKKVGLCLLFIGRLVYYKGCEVLLDAMVSLKKKMAAEEFVDIELRMVGTGVLEEKLRQRVYKEGLEKNVHFLGRISDEEMERQIEACDVFVFPSVANSEAFGLVQLEAMTYGKPVINTSLPTGVPMVSLDGETGLTVPPEDVEALERAIVWMKEHPEERSKMGEKARERVKNEFGQDQMLDRVVAFYKDVCRS